MAIDEALLIAHSEGLTPPTVRFYGWNPRTLSIGYFQQAEREVNLEEVHRRGVGFVRRATGGRAVLHDKELTYSIVVSESYPGMPSGVAEAYRFLSAGLLRGFQRLGLQAEMAGLGSEEGERDSLGTRGEESSPSCDVPHLQAWSPEISDVSSGRALPSGYSEVLSLRDLSSARTDASYRGAMSAACFDSPSRYELTAEGKKIAGSAQMRSKGIILQHGSVPLEDHTDELFELLRFRNEREKERLKRVFRRKAAAVNVCLEARGLEPVMLTEVEEAFRTGFTDALEIQLRHEELTDYEKELAARRAKDKYGSNDWNLRR